MMALLLFAHGVPMVHHGDELGRSQGGNNNPYCQDNEITWTDWNGVDTAFMDDVTRLIGLRHRYPHLRRDRFSEEGSVRLLHVEGRDMDEQDWHDESLKALLLMLSPGPGDPEETLLIALNGGSEPVRISLPEPSDLGRAVRLRADFRR